ACGIAAGLTGGPPTRPNRARARRQRQRARASGHGVKKRLPHLVSPRSNCAIAGAFVKKLSWGRSLPHDGGERPKSGSNDSRERAFSVTAPVSVVRAYFCSSAVAATMASGESVPTRQGGMRVVVMDALML